MIRWRPGSSVDDQSHVRDVAARRGPLLADLPVGLVEHSEGATADHLDVGLLDAHRLEIAVGHVEPLAGDGGHGHRCRSADPPHAVSSLQADPTPQHRCALPRSDVTRATPRRRAMQQGLTLRFVNLC
jgi:hypothetical protein